MKDMMLTMINVKNARTGIKMTQEQFAKELGVSQNRISDWENGKNMTKRDEFAIRWFLHKNSL